MRSRWLYPSDFFSEKRLLISGLLFTLLGSLFGALFATHYNGVIDLHYAPRILFEQPFLENLVNLLCLFFTLFAAARLINRKTRAIDIISTALISRAPYCLMPLLNIRHWAFYYGDQLKQHALNGSTISTATVLVNILLITVLVGAVLLMLWLLYQGFRTSTNAKTGPQTLLFAGSVALAEILSVVFLSNLMKFL